MGRGTPIQIVAVLGAAAAIGCASLDSAARDAAARDFACPAASVSVHATGEADGALHTYFADGCGQSAVYQCEKFVRSYGAGCHRIVMPGQRPAPPVVVAPPLPPPTPPRSLVIPRP